jgi:hypothetical protein
LEFLLNNSYHHKDYEKLCKEAFKFFIHEEVTFLYEQKLIIIGNIGKIIEKVESIEDLVLITEEDFFNFQNLVRECIGKKSV